MYANLTGLWAVASPAQTVERPKSNEEEIVFVRHAEKSAAGLGQLSCQGLNRALTLTKVLIADFGKPDVIIAPNPSPAKFDRGDAFDYVRPLATIEPTAIALGLPVNSHIGLNQLAGLQTTLDTTVNSGRVILVAWEHKQIVSVVRALLAAHGGSTISVPEWMGNDFDKSYIVRIARTSTGTAVTFEQRAEHLNGLAERCP